MAKNIRELEVDDVLFQEGEAADCAYIIESGKLEISTRSEGEKVVICSLGEGDIVGEMGIIDKEPRTATAVALAQTRLTRVTQSQLTDRISGADTIVKLLIKILLDRYRSGLGKVKGDPGDRSPDVVAEYIHQGIDKIRLEGELRDALDTKKQLRVFYQPIIDLQSRKIAGFEALTRWIHPKRGFISPGLFISLAEETDLIVPVGLYVFEQACKDIVKFQKTASARKYPAPLFISINISGRQVADPSFLPRAAEIAQDCGLDKALIKLEITESFAVNLGAASEWINKAHELGFKVSLDDFGTGFSSLETLYRLDLDNAKIDQAFMLELQGNPRNRQLTRDIVAMVKGLGLEVVVEGVEDQSQLEFISALDCHYAQGYLIGKSIPANEVREMLNHPPDLGQPYG
ncbi:MAG: EAL domain-containing protein [Proteobacteria bacterium]|nr:EAL domain-containing protein [Pseudomonadota bacterium]MDA1299808.1 EAL domain-containing protein [Pseudomonadota bacterium]